MDLLILGTISSFENSSSASRSLNEPLTLSISSLISNVPYFTSASSFSTSSWVYSPCIAKYLKIKVNSMMRINGSKSLTHIPILIIGLTVLWKKILAALGP